MRVYEVSSYIIKVTHFVSLFFTQILQLGLCQYRCFHTKKLGGIQNHFTINKIPLTTMLLINLTWISHVLLCLGYCQGDGYRVGFGQCIGTILPSKQHWNKFAISYRLCQHLLNEIIFRPNPIFRVQKSTLLLFTIHEWRELLSYSQIKQMYSQTSVHFVLVNIICCKM